MTSDINFEFPESPSRVAYFGDWHGDALWGPEMIHVAAAHDVDVLAHVGDFGFQRPNPISQVFLSRVNRALKEHNLSLLVAEGNHENFDWLLSLPLDDRGIRPVTSRIAHLPRGFRWEWKGVKYLALGGAHSVNSHLLTPGHDWFPEETISWGQAEEAIGGGHADVMVTHDIPNNIEMEGFRSSSMFPEYQISGAEQHRLTLGMVVDEVRPSLLVHGHMHYLHEGRRPLPYGGDTRVIGLDCNGSDWRMNMALFDVETLNRLPLDHGVEFLPRRLS